MNARCYKTVFSKRLGARVAVGEHASSQGKATGAGGFAGDESQPGAFLGCVGDQFEGFKNGFWGVLSSTFALVALVWATPAWAQPAPNVLPTGGQVVQGAVQFNQSAQQLNIHQSTDRAAINWQSFGIGAAAKVNIQQPSAQSVLLNRVGGESPSQIFGQLTANGQVILINPNGMVFGKDGSVSAAGFTGSTLNISDADFMAGKERYTRSGTAASTSAIVNRGLIQAAPGGYVALLGASVSNEGRIEAPQGNVFMAAADAVTLPSPTVGLPIGQSGRIRLELTPASINAAVANHKGGTIVTEGGQVYLQAAALNQAMATVLQSGSIDTTSVQGGQVHVLADGGRIRVDGQIKSNSTNGTAGGDIYIGRDKDTNVLAAVGDASGAKLESKGGFVETSGQFLATFGTRVTAKDWLLDPVNINIAASGPTGTPYGDSDGATAGVQFSPSTGSTILASDIAANLNAGTNVTVSTGLAGSPGNDAGNITVSSAIVKSGANNASLTLDANNRVIVNARIGRASNDTTSTGNLNVTIVARGNAQTAVQGSAHIANVIDALAGTVDITGTSLSGWEAVIFQGTSGIHAGTYTVRGTNSSTAVRFNGGTATFNSSLGNSLIEGTGGGEGGIFASSGNTINFNTTGTATTTLASSATSTAGMRLGFGGGVTVNTNGNVTIGAHYATARLFTQAQINVNSGHLRILGQSAANGIGLQDGSGVPASISVNNGSSLTLHGISTASGNGIDLRPQGVANSITMSGTNAGQRGTLNFIGVSSTGVGIYTNGATITSDGGNINLTGTSQGTGITHDGLIRSGNDSGGGVVTLTGTSTGSVTPRLGINSSTTIQGGSVVMTGVSSGVQGIYTAALVTATSGSVSLTGTSAQGSGVHLQGAVRATGDVIVDGTSTSADTQGVIIQNALESTSGHIRLTGRTSATTQRAVALTANGAVMANLKVSGARNIDVSGNSLFIHPGATVDAGSSGVVTLKPTSASADILIGADDTLGAQPHLGLSQEELGRIIAGRLDIGDLTRTGRILVSAATVTPAQTGHVRLLTGGDIAIGANLIVGDDPATPAVTEASRQLTLTSGSAITRTAGRLSSTDLFLTAASGIGSSTQRLQTAVSSLSSSSGGDQFISELDGLTLAARSTANNGSMDISSAGTMVVSDVNGLSGVVAHGTGSIKLTATSTTSAGNGLTLTRSITSLGDIQLEGSSASTADYDAGIRSNAVVSGRHIQVLAQATTDTNRPVLGYYGAGGSFVASASLNMTGTTQSVANGLYTFGGLFQSGTGMTLEGVSRYGQGFGLDKQGNSGLVARLLNTTSGQVSITGTAHNFTRQAIGLNGSSVINNGGGVALHATSGNIVSSINPVWGAAASNFNLIESGTSGNSISLTAGANSASTASIDGSFLTLQQNNNGGVRVRTEGLGHLTAPKVNNAGTGNVVLAAGAMLAAGNDGGGQVLTVSGQSVTHSHPSTPGKTYVYSGNLSGTGALSRLSAGFNTLFYNGTSQPLNMAFNAAHGDVISSSAQHQVLFRSAWSPAEAHSLDLSSLLIHKTYGDPDPDLRAALQTAYASNMGPSVLTRTVTGAGGDHVVGLAAADAIATLTGARAGGENASTTPYAYSLAAGLNTSVTGQAGLRINKKALSVALQGGVSKSYDGTQSANNLSPSNFAVTGWVTMNGVTEGAAVTQTAGSYASKDVANNVGGAGLVTADLAAEHFAPTGSTLLSNYTLPTVATGNVGTITRAPLTVKVGSSTMFVTQDPVLAPNMGMTVIGLQNGESSSDVLGALTRNYSGPATPGVGHFTGVYGLTSVPTAANYTVTVQPGNLNVLAADKLLIRLGGRSAIYGDVTAATAGHTSAGQGISAQYCVGGVNCNTISTLTMTDLGAGQWQATDTLGSTIRLTTQVNTTGQTSAAGFLNAGNHDYAVGSWSVLGGQNFTDLVLAAGSLVIAPKTMTLNASNVSKVYDGTQALAGMRLLPGGALPGDDVGVVSNGGSFASKNAGSQAFTLTGLQLQGADRGNYSFASGNVSGTGLITPRQITASFGALDKVYDGTRAASLTGGSLSGVLEGDVVSVGAAGASFADANVSRNALGQVVAKGVQAEGVSLSGADAGNYQVTVDAGSARITPKLLSAVVTAQGKVYDGNRQAQVSGSLLGVLAGDQVALSMNSDSLFASKNVQRDANGVVLSQAVSVRGLALSGAQSGNYELSQGDMSAAARITPKTLNALAVVSDKSYDGTDLAPLTGLSGQGVVAGDDVTLLANSATFADRDVLRDAQGRVLPQEVRISGLRMVGQDTGNYVLQVPAGELRVQAMLQPRLLQVEAQALDKVFDDKTNATIRLGSLMGLVGSEQLGLEASGVFESASVGVNKAVSVNFTLRDGHGGGRASNYSLVAPMLRASIYSAPLTSPVQAAVLPDARKPIASAVNFVGPVAAALGQQETPVAETLSCDSARIDQMEHCACEPSRIPEVLICYVPRAAAASSPTSHPKAAVKD